MILVVDDDIDVRESICKMLRLSGLSCDQAPSARGGLSKLRANPDIQIVILDMRMQDANLPEGYGEYSGMYFLAKYRDIAPTVRVIVLTGYPDMQTAVPALSGGSDAPAVAYLEKPVSNEELLKRIRSLLKEVIVDEFRVDLENEEAFFNDQPFHVTHRQFQVLAHMMLNAGRWVPYEEIPKAIDGEDVSAKEAWTKWRSHISRLRETLSQVAGREVLVSQQQAGHKFLRKPG